MSFLVERHSFYGELRKYYTWRMTPVTPGRFNRGWLLPIALAAGASLVVASWAGLGRIGFRLGSPPAALHGPLMILGFLGTVISLERAVGLGRRWAWAAPALSALGAALLLALDQSEPGLVFLLTGGAVLVAVYGAALKLSNYPPYLVVESLGAVAWVVAASALLLGASVPQVVPLLAVFLILTILGERLELSRMAPGKSGGRNVVLTISAAVLLVAATLVIWEMDLGARLAGVATLVVAGAALSGDIARRTVRIPGLTRYMGAAILAGYVWLALAAVLWISGGVIPGTTLYDPALHTIFVGFVLSMIFAHAPVIVPAVARIQLPFNALWWIALVLLHLSLAVRVGGSLIDNQTVRAWGGAGNVAALGLFILVAAISAARARERL